jgi:hypothetical protein
MRCFACAATVILASGERVGFRDDCARCGADLHVCRNCDHYDPGAYNQCREPQAERVGERERANRCDWFRPRSAGEAAGEPPERAARAALEQLFRKGDG